MEEACIIPLAPAFLVEVSKFKVETSFPSFEQEEPFNEELEVFRNKQSCLRACKG